MKRIFFIIAVCATMWTVAAQQPEAKPEKKSAYQFTVEQSIPTTSVKNQASSGTCWSFAGTAFLESELLRKGKGEYDLSEMWIVRQSFHDKAIKYARMHGTINFAGGGSTADVFNVWRNYGLLPEEAYPGLNYGTDLHRHGELDAVLKAYMDAVIKNPNRQLSTAWIEGVDGILDAYLGAVPAEFEYKGKTYTPKSFAQSLGLDPDDYVSLTSYSHHPFYESFILEIPDNWAWERSYNIPVEELMQVLDASLAAGYTVNWGADVSEPGFMRENGTAWAIVPPTQKESKADSEEAKWVKLSERDQRTLLATLSEPIEPVVITQQMRQEAFDNYLTTDDHGMLITGTATDQNGNRFYLVKNSWGTDYGYDGYLYVSYPFVAYKTMNFAVNKEVLPKALKKKLGIN